jgi:ParB family chromosome partitioning protein
LRLLKLPEKILSLIKDNKLSVGHARLLIGREDAVEIAQIIIKDSLSVRDLEKLLKNFNQKKPLPNKIDPNIVSISKRLSDHLGLNVKIDFKEENQKSKIIIHCSSLDQLNGLIEKLEK